MSELIKYFSSYKQCYICSGADLLLARWAFSPQQSVAQYGAVWLAGRLPAHLDRGGRQSLCLERLDPAGYLDCRDTENTLFTHMEIFTTASVRYLLLH